MLQKGQAGNTEIDRQKRRMSEVAWLWQPEVVSWWANRSSVLQTIDVKHMCSAYEMYFVEVTTPVILLEYGNVILSLGCSASPQCSHSYLGRLRTGVLSSYNYPFDYSHNLTCIYSIYLNIPSEGSHIVCLTFHRFNLESSTPFCSFDYVEIGANPVIKYCGAGLWQYGVIDRGNPNSNIWSRQFCCT